MKLHALLPICAACAAYAALLPNGDHAVELSDASALDNGKTAILGLMRGRQAPDAPDDGSGGVPRPPQAPGAAERQEEEITWFRTIAQTVLIILGVGLIAACGGAIAMCICKPKAQEEEEADEDTKAEEAHGSLAKASRNCDNPFVSSGPDGRDTRTQLMEGFHALSTKLQPEIPRLKRLMEERSREVGDNAKAFLCCELEDVASTLRKAITEDEDELMLEWNATVEASLPPMSVILTGTMSPVILSSMLLSHTLQFFLLFLPVAVLCVAAMIMDQGAIVCVIPTLTTWLWVGGTLAILLCLSHGAMAARIFLGQKALAKKAEELDALIETGPPDATNQDASSQEVFMRAAILLQSAAHLQHDVQTSIFYNIHGACTLLWIPCTFWVTWVIVWWTFYPGVIAFHPNVAAAGVANTDLCEARWTVFAGRVCVLLAPLFMFFHHVQVFGWIIETVVHSKSLSHKILRGAQDFDNSTPLGFPYAEILVRAFVLHGDKDYVRSKLSVMSAEQTMLEQEREELQQHVDVLQNRLQAKERHIVALQLTAEERGGIGHAAQVSYMESRGVQDASGWKEQGRILIHEADEAAAVYKKTMAERSATEDSELQAIVNNINSLVAQVQEQVNASVQAATGSPSGAQALPGESSSSGAQQ